MKIDEAILLKIDSRLSNENVFDNSMMHTFLYFNTIYFIT